MLKKLFTTPNPKYKQITEKKKVEIMLVEHHRQYKYLN